MVLMLIGGGRAQDDSRLEAQSHKVKGFDREINASSGRMMEAGRDIFRNDTFGDEAFWSDALQLHRAMAGAGHGAIVYQQHEGRGIGVINKIRAYVLNLAPILSP